MSCCYLRIIKPNVSIMCPVTLQVLVRYSYWFQSDLTGLRFFSNHLAPHKQCTYKAGKLTSRITVDGSTICNCNAAATVSTDATQTGIKIESDKRFIRLHITICFATATSH
jgi:hypothetical protein